MQSTTNAIHVKAQYNEEFRRFSITQISVKEIETTLRELFNLSTNFSVVMKFQDDEKDWVTFSTDEELVYAHQLDLTNPLRVMISIDPNVVKQQHKVGKCNWSKKEGNGRADNSTDWVKDKQAQKLIRITNRIQNVQLRLQAASTNSNQSRILQWRLEKLEGKKDLLENKLSNNQAEKPQIKEGEENIIAEQQQQNEAKDILKNQNEEAIFQLRQNLKAAKLSGDSEKVKECRQALIKMNKETRMAAKKQRLPNPDQPTVQYSNLPSDELMQKIKSIKSQIWEAKLEGNEEKLLAYKEDIFQLRKELQTLRANHQEGDDIGFGCGGRGCGRGRGRGGRGCGRGKFDKDTRQEMQRAKFEARQEMKQARFLDKQASKAQCYQDRLARRA